MAVALNEAKVAVKMKEEAEAAREKTNKTKNPGFLGHFFEAQLPRLGECFFFVFFFWCLFWFKRLDLDVFVGFFFDHFCACCFFLEVFGLSFLGNLDFFRILA